jgi:hypothetical protein
MFDEITKLSLKQFLNHISIYQEKYKHYKKLLDSENLSANEVEYIYKQKNKISEEVCRFILEKKIEVEILNNKLLENK